MTVLTFRQALCGPLRKPAQAVAEQRKLGWRARADAEPWPLKLPIDWAADPFEDRNWRFQLNAWRPIDVLITAHDMREDDALLDDVVALMLDWERHEGEHPDDALLWNDMGTGLRASKLAYVLSQPGLADARFDDARETLVNLALRHMTRLLDRSFIGESNHGLFQIHGLMALTKALPHAPQAATAEAYVEEVFTDLLHQQFGQEGVHLEHSPGYHQFALKTIRRFANSGWYETMPEVQDTISRAEALLPWFSFPDGRMSALGDSSRVPSKARTISEQPLGGRLFREAGYAVIRDDKPRSRKRASMLLIAGGHHSNVHKHADDLSFEWFAKGRHVIVDTGKYSYSRAEWRTFTDGASAHNAIDLLEERTENGVRKTPPVGGMLDTLEQHDWGWIVRGGFSREAYGVSHRRTFLYAGHQSLVLLDRVHCDEPRQVTAWLHLAPELEAERDGLGWTFPGGTIRYLASEAGELNRFRGQTKPQIQGWTAVSYHQRTPNDALGLSLTGTDLRIVTLITLDGAEAPEAILADGGFRVMLGGEVIFEGDA